MGSAARKDDIGAKLNKFWQRVTDGLELNQLWTQFRTDARASYRLYSHDVDTSPREGMKAGKHWFEVAKQSSGQFWKNYRPHDGSCCCWRC